MRPSLIPVRVNCCSRLVSLLFPGSCGTSDISFALSPSAPGPMFLKLQGNQLVALPPQEKWTCRQLKTLDLSRNHFGK